MKKISLTVIALFAFTTITNAQIGAALKNKASQAVNKNAEGAKMGTSSPSKDTKAMEGTWKVDGVIVTTEMEALKDQIGAQEKQYNDAYKGSTWVFKKDGTITITLPKSESSVGGTEVGKYELIGEKIQMLIGNQPNEFDLKFEDGQMLLINTSPLNTIYYVYIKG